MSHTRHLLNVFWSSSSQATSWWEVLGATYRVRTCSVKTPKWCYWKPLLWKSSPWLITMVLLTASWLYWSGVAYRFLLRVSACWTEETWMNPNFSLKLDVCSWLCGFFNAYSCICMTLKQRHHFGMESWCHPPQRAKLSLLRIFFSHFIFSFRFSFFTRVLDVPSKWII